MNNWTPTRTASSAPSQMTGTQGLKKMFVSTAFITNIRKCFKKLIFSSPTALILRHAHTTAGPFPQGQFKTETVHSL